MGHGVRLKLRVRVRVRVHLQVGHDGRGVLREHLRRQLACTVSRKW